MKIDGITLSSDALFAPIAGYSDVGLRSLCAEAGAGLTYTEMVSAKGLIYGNEHTEDLLHTTVRERVTAVQIFGSEPEIMARAAESKALEKFDIIDINMGCPVRKIVSNGEGSALLKNPSLAAEIVRTVRRAGKPVTVKFRIGFEKNSRTGVDFAKYMQDAGAAAITVHGRTREQFYEGKADRDYIAEVVRAVEIPVIANGDVHNKEDYEEMKAHTGAAGVMIARGALGAPQIFAEITGAPFGYATVRDIVLKHIEILSSFHSETYVVNNMKKHVAYYCKGLRGGKQLKLDAFAAKSLDELVNAVKNSGTLDAPVCIDRKESL